MDSAGWADDRCQAYVLGKGQVEQNPHDSLDQFSVQDVQFCGLGRCTQIRVGEHIEALDVSPMIGLVGIYCTDGLSSRRLFRLAQCTHRMCGPGQAWTLGKVQARQCPQYSPDQAGSTGCAPMVSLQFGKELFILWYNKFKIFPLARHSSSCLLAQHLEYRGRWMSVNRRLVWSTQ